MTTTTTTNKRRRFDEDEDEKQNERPKPLGCTLRLEYWMRSEEMTAKKREHVAKLDELGGYYGVEDHIEKTVFGNDPEVNVVLEENMFPYDCPPERLALDAVEQRRHERRRDSRVGRRVPEETQKGRRGVELRHER